MKETIFGIIGIIAMISIYTWYSYTQHFNQNNKETATSGIFFKTTLNLKEYRNVSTGNNLWGTFDRYTRSDRHNEQINVYCNNYCKK